MPAHRPPPARLQLSSCSSSPAGSWSYQLVLAQKTTPFTTESRLTTKAVHKLPSPKMRPWTPYSKARPYASLSPRPWHPCTYSVRPNTSISYHIPTPSLHRIQTQTVSITDVHFGYPLFWSSRRCSPDFGHAPTSSPVRPSLLRPATSHTHRTRSPKTERKQEADHPAHL